MKESTERIKKLPKERRLELAQSNPTTTTGMREKYAAISASIDEGDLEDKEIKSIIANKESAKKWHFDFKKLAKYAPEHSKELTGKETIDIINAMTPKDAREKIRVESLNNVVVQASLNEKQRKNINEFGTQKQKDALNGTTAFDEIKIDQIMQLNQTQINNLHNNMNESQQNTLENNKKIRDEYNDKIEEIDNNISNIPPAGQSTVTKIQEEKQLLKDKMKLLITGNTKTSPTNSKGIDQELKQ